jgi:hypothetical protein
MMISAIRTLKNQYRGINAHLHSFWQAENKWNRFHNAHASLLMFMLKAQLLPLGYTAEIEESVQIRFSSEKPRAPHADVLIRDLDPLRAGIFAPSVPIAVKEAQMLDLAELVTDDVDDRYFSAVAIYERKGENPSDEPIGWLEVLSPTNKGNTRDAGEYRYKRQRLLKAGCVFIELDYLHETPPTWDTLPDYTLQEPKSHPFRIMVLVPRPNATEGYAYLYEFDVDTPLPKVMIPLSGTESMTFDFDAAYQKTFIEGSYGFDRELDYRQVPLHFERYNTADQTHIARRMLAILQAQQRGDNLEEAPFPVEDTLSLGDAMQGLNAVGA